MCVCMLVAVFWEFSIQNLKYSKCILKVISQKEVLVLSHMEEIHARGRRRKESRFNTRLEIDPLLSIESKTNQNPPKTGRPPEAHPQRRRQMQQSAGSPVQNRGLLRSAAFPARQEIRVQVQAQSRHLPRRILPAIWPLLRRRQNNDRVGRGERRNDPAAELGPGLFHGQEAVYHAVYHVLRPGQRG